MDKSTYASHIQKVCEEVISSSKMPGHGKNNFREYSVEKARRVYKPICDKHNVPHKKIFDVLKLYRNDQYT